MSEKSQKSQIENLAIGNTNYCSRGRRWCMTINNYTENQYLKISKIFQVKKWKYIIGKEIGEVKNTPHLQIYFESEHQVRFTAIKKLFPTAHIERAKGRKKENLIYCNKDSNFETNFHPSEWRTLSEAEVFADMLSIALENPIIENIDIKWA